MNLWQMVQGALRPVPAGASIRVARPGATPVTGLPGAVVGRLDMADPARGYLAAAGYYVEHLSGPDLGTGYGPPYVGVDADLRAAAVRDPLPAAAPPDLEDVRPGALAAIAQARAARLAAGWWMELDLGQGAQWYLYPGWPPEDRALIAGARDIALMRVAAGQPDAAPYRCRSQADADAGWPAVQRLHTAAQLGAVLASGGALLAALGQLWDVGVATVEAAESVAECQAAAADTAQAMAGLLLPPPLPIPEGEL